MLLTAQTRGRQTVASLLDKVAEALEGEFLGPDIRTYVEREKKKRKGAPKEVPLTRDYVNTFHDAMGNLPPRSDDLLNTSKENLYRARRGLADHISRNKKAYGAGAVALVGAAGYLHGMGKDKSTWKGKVRRSIGRHPKLALGVAAGSLATAALANHEHHKKAEVLAGLVTEGYSVAEACHLIKQASTIY